jgi:hypothetical protein
LKQLNRDYGVTLGREDVQQLVIKEFKKQLLLDQHLVTQKVYDKSVITVLLENPTIKLKRTSTK